MQSVMNKKEELEFFEGLCRRLQEEPFEDTYPKEEDLKPYVVEVIKDYVNSLPYKDKITVWDDIQFIEKVRALGREQCPDISIEIEREVFAAIEIKLLRQNWGLARGIGQAIISSARYHYGIIFGKDMRTYNTEKHEFDENIKSSLWENYRIRLIVAND